MPSILKNPNIGSSSVWKTVYTVPANTSAVIISALYSNNLGASSNFFTRFLDGGVTPVTINAQTNIANNITSSILPAKLALKAGDEFQVKSIESGFSSFVSTGLSFSIGSGGGQAFYSMATNGTMRVISGQTGVLITSSDGITWSNRSTGTPEALYGVVYLNNQFIAYSSGGYIFTSPDGITWTNRGNVMGGVAIYNMIYANGLYVAACNNGKIYTSTDSIAWTSRTTGSANALYKVVWNQAAGLFAFSGSTGYVYTSPDAITWTVQNSSPSAPSYRLIVIGSKFYAQNDSALPYTSTDGITWTPCTIGGLNNTATGSLCVRNNRFFKYSTPYLYESIDEGDTWTRLGYICQGSAPLGFIYINNNYELLGGASTYYTTTDFTSEYSNAGTLTLSLLEIS